MEARLEMTVMLASPIKHSLTWKPKLAANVLSLRLFLLSMFKGRVCSLHFLSINGGQLRLL